MKKKKDRTAPERVRRNEEKKKAAGLVRVYVWVPAGDRERIKEYAAKLRGE